MCTPLSGDDGRRNRIRRMLEHVVVHVERVDFALFLPQDIAWSSTATRRSGTASSPDAAWSS
jgi:hypothetical protein